MNLTRRSTPEGVRRIVYASRYPPTLPYEPPVQALQSGILRSCGGSWRALGSSWRALGHLLGASWRVSGSWRPLGRVLEDLWSDFGGHGGSLKVSWTVLKPSWRRSGSSWGPDRSLKVTLWESKRVPNGLPETTCAQNGETLKLEHGTKDFNDF